jgi:hypothetical protein
MLKEKRNLKQLSLNSVFITLFCHVFCCVLPMIGVIVGLNAFGMFLHAYEGVFITLNIISIIAGFYFTYLHKVKKNCDHNHCHNDRSKIVFWIATGLSLLLMIVPHIFEA